ncbi:MAG: hypothetical protein NVSMB9_09890 [Isosphaeraceae bacterium]
MRSRHTFQPSVCETLEDRVVMNHGGASALRALHGTPPPVPFVGPIGALGDSYTDEYRNYPPDRSTARNWVEILNATRGVSFGPFSNRNLGEPRNQGFAYNWALSAATSNDMVRNQLPGLANQVAQGRIQYAWVFIGGNDFLHVLDDARSGKIPPSQLKATVIQTEAQLEVNFKTAVNTLLAASPRVKVVVATLPDISLVPVAQAAGTSPLARALLEGVGQAIKKYNGVVRATAATSDRVALVDLDAITQKVGSSPTGSIPFGDQTITLRTTSDDYHSFFLADGIHVGTVAQGIIAEAFAQSIDSKFGAQLFPPSPQEIIRLAMRLQRTQGPRNGHYHRHG